MLQVYNESGLKSLYCKFYGRYNDLDCHYKLLLAYVMNDFFSYTFLDCCFHNVFDNG
jgi:hypothetical protein